MVSFDNGLVLLLPGLLGVDHGLVLVRLLVFLGTRQAFFQTGAAHSRVGRGRQEAEDQAPAVVREINQLRPADDAVRILRLELLRQAVGRDKIGEAWERG